MRTWHNPIGIVPVLFLVGAICCTGQTSRGVVKADVATSQLAFVFYGIVSAALLLALAIARFLCRDRFSRLRFAVWVLVWVFLLTILFVLVYGFYDYRPSDFDDILEVLAAGALFGLCTCGIVLPFLILAFTNAFYRQMLYDCLGLASTPHESTDSASEQA